MKKILIIVLLLTSCFATAVNAQQRQVKGIVTGDKGPVEGASIIEKGVKPANGVSADEEGRFVITLKGKSNTLLVSAGNFVAREIQVTDGTMNIALKADPRNLEDVIVLGFAKQKKITVTGAASQVTGEEIRQNPSASLQNGLSGRLPGFSSQQRSGRPGADGAVFYIRGTNSTTGLNQPLIIVDDIEYEYSQFALLDANEVESITILKDASTTAVYGIKGANGVVVVTTRRGKLGKPRITLRTQYATMQPTKLPKYVDAYTAASAYRQAIDNDALYAGTTPTYTFPATDADLALFKNGQDPYGHPNIDWQDALYKKSSQQYQANMDVSGGTDKVKYFVSLGYVSQGSMLKDFNEGQGINGNYFNKRFNYRANLDVKATKDLDLRVDVYGATSQVNSSNVGNNKNDPFYEISSFLSLAPFSYPIKNPNGTWGYSIWQRNIAGGGGYDFNNLIGRLAQAGYLRTYNDNMNFSTNANQKLDFITKGLSFKALVSYQVNYNYNRNMTRVGIPSFIYTAATNTYVPRDANVFTTDKLGLTYTPNSTYRALNLQGYLNYDRNFGNNHIYGLALVSRNTKWRTGSSTYNFIPNNTQGITLRLGYDYKQKYLLQFNGAYNGSDVFQADKKYGLFPSISAGWNIAKESFFGKLNKVVDVLKVRGSYGLVGSDQIAGTQNNTAQYLYIQEYLNNTTAYSSSGTFTSGLGVPNSRIYQGNFGYTSNFFANLQEGQLGNDDVTWEKEKKLDIGIDFSLFKGKLTGSFDYFNNDRYDILTTRKDVSYIFGQTLPVVNLGKNNNKGYEAELAYNGTIGKEFTYSVKGMYAYAVNKVIYQGEPAGIIESQKSTGQSIGQPLIYKWTGEYYQDAADIAKSPKVGSNLGVVHAGNLKYEDTNGDGTVNDLDRGYYGRPNLATTNYSFNLKIGYKGFGINLLFQGAADFNVYFTAEAIRPFTANIQEVHTKSWTPQLGNSALFPIYSLTSNIDNPAQFNSTFWYRSGNYLRLRTAEVSYTVPKAITDKLKLNGVMFYVNGNNLITWSSLFNLYSIDPESNPGNDRLPYPQQKIVNMGVSLTF